MVDERDTKYSDAEFEHYTYEVGRYLPHEWDSDEEKRDFKAYKHVADKRLVWNVIVEDRDRIEVYNIFEHGSFAESLLRIKRKHKTFEEFAEHVRREISYYFWSKSEWEVIVTSWPPYIDADELDRLDKEREKNVAKYGQFKLSDVRLQTSEKIDVCDQVMLNWDNFITYLWNNRRLITKKKLGITW